MIIILISNLVVLVTRNDESSIQESTSLIEAAELKAVSVITRKKIGEGKYGISENIAFEIAESVEQDKCEFVVINSRLKTTQLYNLAKIVKVKVFDREELILEIFSRRASTAEAKLQVELARLRYELPRSKEKIRLAKSSEQPGFFGLGKYELDVVDRDIKKHVSIIKKKLKLVTKRRKLHYNNRFKLNIPIISLSGYTCAGKTALFNYLTNETKEVSPGVFTTLTTHSRSVDLLKLKIILSDTVGFISDIPTYMIESFKSTLEELTYANVVILIIDVSDPIDEFIEKYWNCMNILLELQVSPEKILPVFNKTDLISQEDINLKLEDANLNLKTYSFISAKNGNGIENLKIMLKKMLNEQKLDYSKNKIIIN